MVVIGLVGDAGGAGEAVVGVGHLANAEEGGAGREVVRRGVGIGRGAGDAAKMVTQKRGLVNGVVPILLIDLYMLQAACCVPASIAFGHPNTDLLG